MADRFDRTLPVRLLWITEGAEPSMEQFADDHCDPVCGPEPWFVFEMALAYAINLSRTDGLVPWIRVGDEMISPHRLRELYGASDRTPGDAEVFPGTTSSQ